MTDVMTGNQFRSFATSAIVALGLTGCAAPTAIETTFTDRDAISAPFEKVFVVGIAGTTRARDLFESSMISAVRTGETEAVSSVRQMGSSAVVDRDSVVAAVEQAGADDVIVTRLVSNDAATRLKISRTETKVVRKDDRAADFFRYDYLEFSEPPEISMIAETVLSTEVYSARTRELVWSAQSQSFDKTSLRDIVSAQSEAIANRLRRDGVID